MTKAEEIYKATRKACQIIIERWGYDGFGLSELSHPYGERICTRTLNAVKELLIHDEKRHALEWHPNEKELEIDNMVRKTIYNTQKLIEK